MRRQPNECSQWSINSDEEGGQSIFATLSHNLRKYEEEFRSYDRKPKSYRISKPVTEKVTIHAVPSERDANQNKENDESKQQQTYLSKPMELQKTHRRLFNPIMKQEERESRSRLQLRVIKTSHQQRDDMRLLKTREVKFEKRDKKKFKDKCVDIFAELRWNKNKISLKQIDDINKQTKEEKIDMFLRLLKR